MSSLVALPRMISTSFILCTGEKKCRPTKRSGCALAVARPVIGSVEVLLAKMPPGASIGSASRVTAALSGRFSNTASMIRSQPSSARTSAVGVTRREQALLAQRVEPALGDLRRGDLANRRDAGLGALGRDVLQHAGDAARRVGVGDARAHHSGAEDADLGRPPDAVALRPRPARPDRVGVEEERLDHVLRVLADHDLARASWPRSGPRCRSRPARLRPSPRGSPAAPDRGRASSAPAWRARPRARPRSSGSSACRPAACSRAGPKAGRRRDGVAIHSSAIARSSSGDAARPSTQPTSSASRGPNSLPSSRYGCAASRPKWRTVLVMPVAPGIRPSETSGMPKRIFGVVEREARVADQRHLPAAAERRAGEQRHHRPAERLELAVARGRRLRSRRSRRPRPWPRA